ncbi:unnamed protein product [Eruca vesicaria subsp. sativa]|uniref:H15 domain-containing protein n=1 Tax=Eruca vesicaria subsp. sativa TaxID=29727 RepID=A0ABC8LBH0_ERUVS|nr:unnamed protein product [Eruca vesicaria subsp. sativa]
MIFTPISALNKPDGSSKQAISRYIERSYTGIPPAHGALLTHHLKTLKNNGILVMSKNQRTTNYYQIFLHHLLRSVVVVVLQKEKPTWEHNELPVSRPEKQLQLHAQLQPLIRRPRSRSRKDGALPTLRAYVSGGVDVPKQRGRPPSRRAAGRERKPAVVSAPA